MRLFSPLSLHEQAHNYTSFREMNYKIWGNINIQTFKHVYDRRKSDLNLGVQNLHQLKFMNAAMRSQAFAPLGMLRCVLGPTRRKVRHTSSSNSDDAYYHTNDHQELGGRE